MADENVYLIAIVAPSEKDVHAFLGKPTGGVVEWWVAEDEREDGSDCDSAIFVPRGAQDDMRSLLDNYWDAQHQLWSEEGYPYADTDVSGAWFRPDEAQERYEQVQSAITALGDSNVTPLDIEVMQWVETYLDDEGVYNVALPYAFREASAYVTRDLTALDDGDATTVRDLVFEALEKFRTNKEEE